MEVSAAHKGYIPWNSESCVKNFRHGAHGDGVIKAKDGISSRLYGEDLFHGSATAGFAIGVRGLTASDHIAIRNFESAAGERIAIASFPLIADVGHRSANVSDPFTSLGYEMFSGEHAYAMIVDADKVAREFREVAVDQDERNTGVADSAQGGGVFLARSNDEAIEMVSEHVLNLVLLELRIALRRGDEDEVFFLAQRSGQPFGDLGEEGMNEIGNDKADEGAAAGDETAGSEIRAVVEALDPFEDFCFRVFRDIGAVTQGPRNGDDGHAEFVRYVLESDDHRDSLYISAQLFVMAGQGRHKRPERQMGVLHDIELMVCSKSWLACLLTIRLA